MPTGRTKDRPHRRAATAKQARFIAEYAKDLNATQAAIRAGYSAKTAESQASRLLRNVKVRRELDKLLKRQAARADVKAEDVLRELMRIAMVDIGEAFNEHGNLKPIHEIPPDVRRAISGVDVEAIFEGRGENREHIGNLKKVRFWDKPKTLELLGRYLKLFTDKVEHTGKDGKPIEVKARVKDERTQEQLAATLEALARAGVVAVPQGAESSAAGADAADDGVRAAHAASDAGGVSPP